ncbi:hypothetical protein D7V53_04325 [Escherichia coli]|nr:hypothetical protein [Escherichia coli]RZZ32044.1 hypothetical protein EXX14_11050 [Escherichia coli]
MHRSLSLDVKERENGAEYSSEIGICLRFMIRCANNLETKKDNAAKYSNCAGGDVTHRQYGFCCPCHENNGINQSVAG